MNRHNQFCLDTESDNCACDREGYIKDLEAQLAEAKACLKDAIPLHEMDAAQFQINTLRSLVGELVGLLQGLCYSVAGTEGTKTNSELPEWYKARLKEANEFLKRAGSVIGEQGKEKN